MSLDSKKAAKLSDLTRLMFDEPPAEQPQEDLPKWRTKTIEGLLDDLVAATRMPREYVGYDARLEPSGESLFFSRQLEHVRPSIFDEFYAYDGHRRGIATRDEILRAAYSVRGIEQVRLVTNVPGRLDVHVTQVSQALDRISDYRENIERPVLEAVRGVAAAGVRVRVYVSTPLIEFTRATDDAILEMRRRYHGQHMTTEMVEAFAYDVRHLTRDLLRSDFLDLRTMRESLLTRCSRGALDGCWCVTICGTHGDRTYSRRVELMW